MKLAPGHSDVDIILKNKRYEIRATDSLVREVSSLKFYFER